MSIPDCSAVAALTHHGHLAVLCRDLRRGKATGTAQEVLAGVRVTLTWPEPYAGRMVEEYICPGDDATTMHVVSTLTIGRQSITTTQVFSRHKHGSREALLRESEARNGSAAHVFQRMGIKAPFGMF